MVWVEHSTAGNCDLSKWHSLSPKLKLLVGIEPAALNLVRAPSRPLSLSAVRSSCWKMPEQWLQGPWEPPRFWAEKRHTGGHFSGCIALNCFVLSGYFAILFHLVLLLFFPISTLILFFNLEIIFLPCQKTGRDVPFSEHIWGKFFSLQYFISKTRSLLTDFSLRFPLKCP